MFEFNPNQLQMYLSEHFGKDLSLVIIEFARMQSISDTYSMKPGDLIDWLDKLSFEDRWIYLDQNLLLYWYINRNNNPMRAPSHIFWERFSRESLSQCDKDGKTLLHYAVLRYDNSTIPSLMSLGVRMTKDKDGNLPIIDLVHDRNNQFC